MAAAFRAACMGDLDTVKSCLEGVDAMDINEVDEDDATGWPLLLCAVGGDTGQGRVEGHLDVARYVLSRGADIHFWKAAVAFLARHGDNGVVWNILSFWRATK